MPGPASRRVDEHRSVEVSTLKVDDELLRGIIRGLYYPESPYEFSVLPVDVLRHVYEQFLGKVIWFEDGDHKALVEEKQEVRRRAAFTTRRPRGGEGPVIHF
jgi:hypothetical protein